MKTLENLLSSVGNENYDPNLESLIPSEHLVAREAISNQKKNKFAPLEALVKSWIRDVRKGIKDGKSYEDIRKLSEDSHNDVIGAEIKKVFKMDVTFKTLLTLTGHGFTTSKFLSDSLDLWEGGAGSVDYLQGLLQGRFNDGDEYMGEFMLSKVDHIKNMKINKGIVNLKKAELGGYFSEVPVLIGLDPIQMIQSEFDVPAVMAILLHEIGHIFDGFIYMNRMSSINVLTANISDKFKDGADANVLVRVLEKAGKEDVLKSDILNELKKGGEILLPYNYMRVMQDSIMSVSANFYSDITNSEASADNFAVRCGYGPALIDVMSHFSHGETLENYIDDTKANLGIVMALAFDGLLLTAGVALITINITTLLGGFATMGGIIVFSTFFIKVLLMPLMAFFIGTKKKGVIVKPGIYDVDAIRIKRIRDGMVEYLKSYKNSISPTESKLIRDHIRMVDLFSDRFAKKNNISVFINGVYDLVVMPNDQKEKMRKRDKLESLMQNDAFVAAIEFELLASEA